MLLSLLLRLLAMADADALLWGDTSKLVTLGEIQTAQTALATYPDVLRTPMLSDWPLDLGSAGAGGQPQLSLKLESLQTTGSFKLRGMRYKLHTSDVAQLRAAGVVTLSSGNAGRAVSYMCQAEGIDAKVYMPENAPDHKKEMMEGLGATVVKVPGQDLLDEVAACITAEDRVLVHPFDDLDLIRGHASCGAHALSVCLCCRSQQH
eukprot:COSAG06_NODE_6411_length_2944_cov_14.298770_2_plen_206_part_00